MSAINWDQDFAEPWRSIGKEWCEMLFAIANGGVARPPEAAKQWDGAAFKERLQFYRINSLNASKFLQVSTETVARWARGEMTSTHGRRVAIEAMFRDAELKRLSH